MVWGSYGSVNVTGNSAIWYSAPEFILAIHSNYDPILHSFWDNGQNCRSEPTPPVFGHWNFAKIFGTTPKNYSPGAAIWQCLRDHTFSGFDTILACDRQTDEHTITAYTMLA